MLRMPLKRFPAKNKHPQKLFLHGQLPMAVVQGGLAPSLADSRSYQHWPYDIGFVSMEDVKLYRFLCAMELQKPDSKWQG